jgi:hypothetical protein
VIHPELFGARIKGEKMLNLSSHTDHKSDVERALACSLTGLFLLLSGCKSIGPEILPQDRMAYNKSICDSWQEQNLLNIVRLRYVDTPLFMDVASVISGYTLERSVNLNGQLSTANAIQGDSIGLGAGGRMTDRPTITYAPVIGERFNQKLMTPISPERLLFLIQSGWPADLVLNVTLDSINGLNAPVSIGENKRQGNAEFARVIELIRQVQRSNAIGMRINQSGEKKHTTLLIMKRNDIDQQTEEAFVEMCELLKLSPDASEFELSYGFLAQSDMELVCLSRSILQIMVELSAYIRIPAAHKESGICATSTVNPDNESFVILSSSAEPQEVAVKVFYRDHWYYIRDSDLESKRIFGFMMLLFSLTESGETVGLPLVTIPAQ